MSPYVLHRLWIAVATIDAVAALLTALYLFRLDARFAKYVAFLCFGIAADALFAIFAAPSIRSNLTTVIWRIAGRILETIPMIILFLYLLDYIPDSEKPD